MHVDPRPEDVGLSTPRLDRVSRWMRRRVASGWLLGLLVAIVQEGESGRFASNYTRPDEGGLALIDAAAGSRFLGEMLPPSPQGVSESRNLGPEPLPASRPDAGLAPAAGTPAARSRPCG